MISTPLQFAFYSATHRYQVAGDHMRECPDVFEIPLQHEASTAGIRQHQDHQEQHQHQHQHHAHNNNGSLWAMKASSAPFDQYVVGSYTAGVNDSFVRVPGSLDFGYDNGAVGNGQLFDSGNMYAGKTFWDARKGRRVLWGWVHEEPGVPLAQQWEGILSIPRTVALDPRNGSKLVFMPIEEVATLRRSTNEHDAVAEPQSKSAAAAAAMHFADVNVCSECKVTLGAGNQIDVVFTALLQPDGTANFTLSVLANSNLHDGVNITITVASASAAAENRRTAKSINMSRSRMNGHVAVNSSSGGTYEQAMPSAANFSVYADEQVVRVRVLVDRSVVETFVQDGRAVVTRRAYINLRSVESSSSSRSSSNTLDDAVGAEESASNSVVVVNHHADSMTVNSTVYQMASATDNAASADGLRAEVLDMMVVAPKA